MRHAVYALALALLCAGHGPAARADEAPALSKHQVGRLAQLTRVWGTVRYLHPYLGYKPIDWDEALVQAVPKVVRAKTTEEYAAAVQGMLAVLRDPMTAVVRQAPVGKMVPAPAGKADADKLFTRLDGGTLAVRLTGPNLDGRFFARPAQLAALAKELRQAPGVIFDLRDGAWPQWAFQLVEKIEPLLPSRDLLLPAQRYLVHSGYKTQGAGSPGYGSAFHTSFRETIRPAGRKGIRSVFVVNERSDLPLLALALQQAGDAFVVSQGKLPAGAGVRVETIPLAGGAAARVRLTEVVDGHGAEAAAHADVEVPAGGDPGPDGPAYKAALALLAGKGRVATPAKAGPPLPPAVWRPDKAYHEMSYPDLGHRLLALARLWNVIHSFYAYPDLIGDWDAVLTEFVPKFAAARDDRAYALAVAEMAAHVADNHTTVGGSTALQKFFGEALPQVQVRWVEGAPVVTEVWGEAAKETAGPRAGDVLVKVDGESAEQRMARFGKYLAASTPATHKRNILRRAFLGGPAGSAAHLTVRREAGALKEVEVGRLEVSRLGRPLRHGEVIRVLPGKLGYVDLDRLTMAEIDPMFDKLKDTRGIIFDMRGYPKAPVAWYVAPRLNTKKARYAAAFQRRLVSAVGGAADRFAFLQPLPATDKAVYRGKVVMLIDERTQSAAEHTGLFFEAACGVTFIGSHSSGANGDVTTLVLPGGLTVMFTGHDVRHADGRQLQRVGLVPHVEVAPTVRGIREGRDEVLERAVRFLQEGK
jgi:C-terminal processing protease CtpA/Prc